MNREAELRRPTRVGWSARLAQLGSPSGYRWPLAFPLFLEYAIQREKEQAAKEPPNQQVATDMEIPSRSDCGRKAEALPNSVQNGIVGSNAGEVYKNESCRCENKSEPCAPQAPKGTWAFVYPPFGESDAESQCARGESSYVLGETVECGHLFLECVAEDLGLLYRYLMRFFFHKTLRANIKLN